MGTNRILYRTGVGLAVLSVVLLIWLSLGVGINGPDGDPFDRIYIVVIVIGILGAIVSRFKASGMARSLSAMAIAQMVVATIALISGKHLSGVSPILEILALNGIFASLFLGSAWLFWLASR